MKRMTFCPESAYISTSLHGVVVPPRGCHGKKSEWQLMGRSGAEVKRRLLWRALILCVCAALIMPAGCGGSFLYTPHTISESEEDQLVFNDDNSLFMDLWSWGILLNFFCDSDANLWNLHFVLQTVHFYCLLAFYVYFNVYVVMQYLYCVLCFVLRIKRSCLKKCRARRRRLCRPALHLMQWQRKPSVPVVALR